MMLGLALLPDLWLWFDAVSTWPLALAIAWWIPSALLLLAETGLQFGVYHRLSVRVLFTMILFSVMPKIVYILLSLFLPWWVAILPALFMIGGFIFGFTKGWRKLEVKQITYSSPDLPPYFDGYKILHFTDFHLGTFPKDTDFVERVVECANNEDVELMVFTGDLVNNSATEVAPYLETLKQLHAPDGIYSVTFIISCISNSSIFSPLFYFNQLSLSAFKYALNISRSSFVVSLIFLSEPAAKCNRSPNSTIIVFV